MILGGGDVMATAETGSGKTAAFVLPAIQLCVEKKLRDATLYYHDCHDSIQVTTAMNNSDNDYCFQLWSNDKKNGWIGWRSPIGFSSSSKFYWECTYTTSTKDAGIVRLGLSTLSGNIHNLGTDQFGWGYGSTGWKVHNNEYTEYGNNINIQQNDVIGCYFDGNNIHFTCNGKSLGVAFTYHHPPKDESPKITLYPSICMKKKSSCQVTLFPPFQYHQTFQFHNNIHPSITKVKQFLVSNPNCQARGPFAIILEPTKDLARQTYESIQNLSRYLIHTKIRAELLVGGNNNKKHKTAIDIVVGTPQVVMNQQKKNNWNACQLFILDEADELIDNQEFLKQIYSLYSKLVQNQSKLKQKCYKKHTNKNPNIGDMERFQVCFFSATLRTDNVKHVTSQICQNPLWVDVNDEKIDGTHKINECVVHLFIKIKKNPSEYIPSDDSMIQPITDAVHRGGILHEKSNLAKLSKPEQESECIKVLKPMMAAHLIEMLEMEQVLIFCRTNLDCELLEKYFHKKSSSSTNNNNSFLGRWSCCVLAGKKRSTEDRMKSLKSFQNGEVRIMIATDAASRGIDIKELPFVINMTLPDIPQTYIHRVGRLGRAQKRMGFALSFVTDTFIENKGGNKSRFREKVWYCQSGNYPPCQNTDLYEEGGNCIWNDEFSQFERINKEILKKQENCHVEEMEWPNCDISPKLKSMIDSKGYFTPKQEEQSAAILRQMIPIQQKVQTLQALQTNLENDFWVMNNIK